MTTEGTTSGVYLRAVSLPCPLITESLERVEKEEPEMSSKLRTAQALYKKKKKEEGNNSTSFIKA